MSHENPNPPAFPRPYSTAQLNGAELLSPAFPGMSLRDWFAGQALAGFVVRQSAARTDAHHGAGFAYQYADAMLAERAKGGSE